MRRDALAANILNAMSWLSKQLSSVGKIATKIGKEIAPEHTFVGKVLRKGGALFTPYGFTSAGTDELKRTLGDTGYKVFRGAQTLAATAITAGVVAPAALSAIGVGSSAATAEAAAATAASSAATSAATVSAGSNILSLGGSYATLSATSALPAIPIVSSAASSAGIIASVGSAVSTVVKSGATALTTAKKFFLDDPKSTDPAAPQQQVMLPTTNDAGQNKFEFPQIPQWAGISAIALILILLIAQIGKGRIIEA